MYELGSGDTYFDIFERDNDYESKFSQSKLNNYFKQ